MPTPSFNKKPCPSCGSENTVQTSPYKSYKLNLYRRSMVCKDCGTKYKVVTPLDNIHGTQEYLPTPNLERILGYDYTNIDPAIIKFHRANGFGVLKFISNLGISRSTYYNRLRYLKRQNLL